jgi:hypothetical protein
MPSRDGIRRAEPAGSHALGPARAGPRTPALGPAHYSA